MLVRVLGRLGRVWRGRGRWGWGCPGADLVAVGAQEGAGGGCQGCGAGVSW